MKSYNCDTDFLNDDQFIEWRLFRTNEQEQYWEHFAREHPGCTGAMNEAIRKFDAVKLNYGKLPEATQDKLFQKIVTDGNDMSRKQKRKIPYLWLAAASIVLLLASALVFFHDNRQPVLPDSYADDAFVGYIMPSDEIRLVMGKETVTFNRDIQVIIGNNGMASVTDNIHITEYKLANDAVNRLIVPPGRRSKLQLSDGTEIWLNSGTEIEFPSGFTTGSREISMKGEIYIEVAKAGNTPFHVSAGQFMVKVLGTSFNISSYPESAGKSVVLVDGSVEVDAARHGKVRLSPGEMLSMDDGQFKKTKVDATEVTSWKDGILTFRDTPISEVLIQIGRHYNVRFEDHDSNRKEIKTCTGKLFLSDNFEEVMTSLSVLTSTEYYKKDNIIHIKDK